MINVFKLILPIIIPSWRFFDVIAPSPRINYVLLDKDKNERSEWVEFRPRLHSIPFPTILRRIFFNPQWNENLFMTSCAERILENTPSSAHSEVEIINRIRRFILNEKLALKVESVTHIQFCLVVLERKENSVQSTTYFKSKVVSLKKSEYQ